MEIFPHDTLDEAAFFILDVAGHDRAKRRFSPDVRRVGARDDRALSESLLPGPAANIGRHGLDRILKAADRGQRLAGTHVIATGFRHGPDCLNRLLATDEALSIEQLRPIDGLRLQIDCREAAGPIHQDTFGGRAGRTLLLKSRPFADIRQALRADLIGEIAPNLCQSGVVAVKSQNLVGPIGKVDQIPVQPLFRRRPAQ